MMSRDTASEPWSESSSESASLSDSETSAGIGYRPDELDSDKGRIEWEERERGTADRERWSDRGCRAGRAWA